MSKLPRVIERKKTLESMSGPPRSLDLSSVGLIWDGLDRKFQVYHLVFTLKTTKYHILSYFKSNVWHQVSIHDKDINLSYAIFMGTISGI